MRFSVGFATAALLSGIVNADPIDKRAAIDDCLKTAGVPSDSKGSTDWNQDVAPFNQRLPYTPLAIAVPTSIAHIQAAVSCAAANGIKVNPKGGGHSYASFGLGGENGHLVVELDRMNKVTLDSSTNIATIQPGARLGHVLNGLWTQGKRAFSHGTCPGVGLAGHSLHGGFGFSSHTHGLALDWIVGVTVVLANGTAVNASATENTDLFWAVRGAGSNFGIVAEFRFNTFAPPSQVTVFSANLPWNSASSAASGWAKLQTWVQNTMPPELNMRIFGNRYSTSLQGMYYGTSSGLQSAINPLLSQLGASLGSTQTTDFYGGFTAYANGQTVDMTHPYNLQENFFSKSLITTNLSTAALNAATSYWFSTAMSNSRDWYIIIDMYGGTNAAIPGFGNSTSSYAHRDKLFLYEFYDRISSGTYQSQWFDFLNGWVKSFTSNLADSQWGMYINYADPTMSRSDAINFYYRNSLPRLQQIKKAVDPTEVFYYPQSIPPAA